MYINASNFPVVCISYLTCIYKKKNIRRLWLPLLIIFAYARTPLLAFLWNFRAQNTLEMYYKRIYIDIYAMQKHRYVLNINVVKKKKKKLTDEV